MRAARIAALSFVGAVVVIASPATATADPAVSGDSAAVNDATVEGVTDYWTADRMEAAVDLDVEVDPGELSAEVDTGDALDIDPTLVDSTGDPWTGGGDVVNTAGRVFFQMDGQDAACSGNAVTSDNGLTVLTAGHCVKYQGAWHTNWVFVPGYDNGERPFGTWAATSTLSTPRWVASEDINFDVGAGVVGALDGERLTDVVGSQAIAFNVGYNQNMYAFGYPAADPYDGERLIYCS
ncbi:MAG: trypsin-like serine peptidase, partial [Stackebrandtia sp.]